MQLREVENSFTLTLYPVTITEARDPNRFNVSAFVDDVSDDDERATPGKGVVPSQKYITRLLWDLEDIITSGMLHIVGGQSVHAKLEACGMYVQCPSQIYIEVRKIAHSDH